VAAGARPAADPAEAVRGADVVLTMLAGPEALSAVADQVVPELSPGTYWIEMSTVGPDAIKALNARLPQGVTLIDAPVTGSTDKAADGQLGILAGGDADAVADLLSAFGTVTRTGPLGSGAALKLVVNTAVIGGVALVAEAMALADALGVDEATAKAALTRSPLGGAVPRAFATDVHFDVELGVKDVALATEVTRLPAMEAVLAHLKAHPDIAHEDIAALADRIRNDR
ncbi:NAD(P)-binding domain-containing protein, partial [Streptomyces sp. T-3]|nr:NAD(P)-binding domain-containing protein [Streptomyces sp. T-3]